MRAAIPRFLRALHMYQPVNPRCHMERESTSYPFIVIKLILKSAVNKRVYTSELCLDFITKPSEPYGPYYEGPFEIVERLRVASADTSRGYHMAPKVAR